MEHACAMPLTRKQVETYREHGYLLLPGLVPAARLDDYERRFLEFARGSREPSPGMKIMRDVMIVRGATEPERPEDAVNKAFGFQDDPGLFAYTLEPGILAAVRRLIGETVYSITTNLFNKPPGVDGRHPLHQDLWYFSLRPAEGIVGTWTALTHTTRENGCLAVVPNSHRGKLLRHTDPDWEYVNYAFFGIAEQQKLRERLPARRHIEMQRGDTLLFHPLLVHGSGHNASGSPRRAISSHYAAAQCHSPEGDWRAWEQVRRIG